MGGCLGHFLHEQRDAVGPLNDVLSDTPWQRFVARYAVNHCSDFALAEAIKGESGDIGPTIGLTQPAWKRLGARWIG